MKTSARAPAILGAPVCRTGRRNLFRSGCGRTEVRAPVGFRRCRSEGTAPHRRIGVSKSTVDSHFRYNLRLVAQVSNLLSCRLAIGGRVETGMVYGLASRDTAQCGGAATNAERGSVTRSSRSRGKPLHGSSEVDFPECCGTQ